MKIDTIYNISAKDLILLLDAASISIDVFFYEYPLEKGKYPAYMYRDYVMTFDYIQTHAKHSIIAIGDYEDNHVPLKSKEFIYSHKIEWVIPSCDASRFIYIWSKKPIEGTDITNIVADYSNCCKESNFKCPLPEELVRGIAMEFILPGQLVCDPYSGSAKISRVLKSFGHPFVASEIDKNTWEKSIKLLDEVKSDFDLTFEDLLNI